MQYAALAILSYHGVIILQNLLISAAYGSTANLEGQNIWYFKVYDDFLNV